MPGPTKKALSAKSDHQSAEDKELDLLSEDAINMSELEELMEDLSMEEEIDDTVSETEVKKYINKA